MPHCIFIGSWSTSQFETNRFGRIRWNVVCKIRSMAKTEKINRVVYVIFFKNIVIELSFVNLNILLSFNEYSPWVNFTRDVLHNIPNIFHQLITREGLQWSTNSIEWLLEYHMWPRCGQCLPSGLWRKPHDWWQQQHHVWRRFSRCFKLVVAGNLQR